MKHWRVRSESHGAPGVNLPTFDEINLEDLPPFREKNRGIFLCSENIAIFYLTVAQNELFFLF